MELKDEVAQFLKDFVFKLEFWGLFIRTDRSNPKNRATILALEFKQADVKEILKELKPENYSEGPFPDKLYDRGDMWLFGKILKGKEVYIKNQLGIPNSHCICISFHFSEHNMNYPLKNIIV